MYARVTRCRLFTLLFVTMIVSGATLGWAQDVQTVSRGERIELTELMVPGKMTLVDFYADWCGPCRALNPTLENLARANPDTLALRKIDIINWDSAVAKQFSLQSIPHLKLYNEHGALVAEGNPNSVIRALKNQLAGGNSRRAGASGFGRTIAPIVLLGGLGVLALYLVFRGKSTARPLQGRFPDHPRPAIDPASNWFVMIQNSLEGPFSEKDLEQMLRRREIDGTARARRRGQSTWTPVEDVVAELM